MQVIGSATCLGYICDNTLCPFLFFRECMTQCSGVLYQFYLVNRLSLSVNTSQRTVNKLADVLNFFPQARQVAPDVCAFSVCFRKACFRLCLVL